MTLAARIVTRLSPAFALDVSFAVEPGVTILFGASGSGKTTILRCVAGLARPAAGRITIDGRALFDDAAGIDVPPQLRRIGYVFQQLALFPHMSAAANIGYGLAHLTRAQRRGRVARAAASFRIEGLLARRPGQISGGERQRVALARALVTDPQALLLDEPLSALDYAIQQHIMEDLRRWNDARRIPILYVTHSHREAYSLGDRLIAIEGGRVTASGSPHDVLDHPSHATLAQLAGFENVFDAVVSSQDERSGTMHCRLGGTPTEIEVPLATPPAGARVRIAIRAGDILLASQQPAGLSARNVLHGTVVDYEMRGATVVATIQAGVRFVVHLTPGGADATRLRTGAAVWLIIKTYSCRIASG
jgi:molybdate transport system ATP-binding protein